jgi:hypothetical protein
MKGMVKCKGDCIKRMPVHFPHQDSNTLLTILLYRQVIGQKNEAEISPQKREKEVYDRFKWFAFPKKRGINEELEYQAGGPKQEQSQRHVFSQACIQKVICTSHTKYSHQEDHECYKKGMHVHHLPVDQAYYLELFFPLKVFWKDEVDQG